MSVAGAAIRGRTHGEHQSPTSLASDVVEHPSNTLDQRVHLGDAFFRRPVFEERRKAIEVEFDAVAVVAFYGFLDQPKRIVPDLVAAEVHRALAAILLGPQPPVGMIDQELRPQKIVAVIVVHAKGQQRLAPRRFASASITA